VPLLAPRTSNTLVICDCANSSAVLIRSDRNFRFADRHKEGGSKHRLLWWSDARQIWRTLAERHGKQSQRCEGDGQATEGFYHLQDVRRLGGERGADWREDISGDRLDGQGGHKKKTVSFRWLVVRLTNGGKQIIFTGAWSGWRGWLQWN